MDNYTLINQKYYSTILKQAFKDHRADKWGSQSSQLLRFEILSQIHPSFFQSSILDVGCGIGHLLDFLLHNQFKGEYHGIDLIDEMIETAYTRHPSFSFSTLPYGHFPELYYDFVVASGIFTMSNSDIMKTMITKMFDRCCIGLAFNSLSQWAPSQEAHEFYANPLEVIQFCKEITSNVVLNHSYLPHDFTIYMFKK